jgi:hypothetical protein
MWAKISGAVLVFSMCLSVAWAAEKTQAEKNGDLVRHVKKGSSITVTGFSEKLRAFSLIVTNEPAVGPNYAAPEELRRGAGLEDDVSAMIRNKDQIVGTVYQVKKPLLLMTENEVIKRGAKK